MPDTISPYLEQPSRSLEEVLRQRADGDTVIRGDRGRSDAGAAINLAILGQRHLPVRLPWSIGLSLYAR